MASDDAQTAQRRQWISTLSKSHREDIEARCGDLTDIDDLEYLRRPETGLIMVRGRMGGSGRAFNAGEVTVTRCSVRLGDGTCGHGYIMGRDERHAALAAILDALLQTERAHGQVLDQVIAPLDQAIAERQRMAAQDAAETKVEFFTLARGED